MTGRHIIAIATGQGVANLPPLLEIASPGDRLLWLVSPEARRQEWLTGVRAVLADRGLPTGEELAFADNQSLQQTLAGSLPAEAAARPVLIANGGTKMHLLTAWEALGTHKPVIVYGSDRPVGMYRHDDGPGSPPTFQAYTQTIDLQEVLRASGYGLVEEPASIWPSLPPQPEPDYGRDRTATADLHGQHHRYSHSVGGDHHVDDDATSRDDSGPPSPDWQGVKWEKLEALAPQARQEWLGQVKGSVRAMLPPHVRKHVDRMDDEKFAKHFGPRYNATLNLARDAMPWAARARAGIEPPAIRIGTVFEHAVAHRVHRAVTEHPEWQAVLAGCWSGVKVARAETPARVAAEIDILLLLRNGILLALECKSFNAEIKDLDARLLKLVSAGSQLARFSVVGPVFTDYRDEPWFEDQHRLARQVQGNRMAFIPLTLPGQAASYQWPGRGEESDEEYRVPAFEDALTQLLQPYVSA